MTLQYFADWQLQDGEFAEDYAARPVAFGAGQRADTVRQAPRGADRPRRAGAGQAGLFQEASKARTDTPATLPRVPLPKTTVPKSDPAHPANQPLDETH